MLSTQFSGHSHRGQRPRNEDCVRWDRALGFAAVADGLGGHPAGHIASRVAVDLSWAALCDVHERSTNALSQALLRAHQALRTLAATRPDYARMATTIVAALLNATHIHIAHVGDSRLYRLRANRLQCLTVDHAFSAHRLTRALGMGESLQIDTATHTRHAEDIYLLCSDGLSGSVPDDRLAELLARPDAADALLEASLKAGATDNISLIVATPLLIS
jgi:serine/threonine protein phosphatase PrpC